MNRVCQCLTAVILSVAVISFHSCQKENSTENRENEIVSKVNKWLDGQKPPDKPNKTASIDLLKENLDFSAIRYEGLSEDEEFLIVPVKDAYKKTKKFDENSAFELLLVTDKIGNIKRGTIAQYIPEAGQMATDVPENTFHKIYNHKTLDCSGRFRFLSVTGRWLYQYDFKNGEFQSSAVVQSKPEAGISNNVSARTNTCWHWYWVTSYYEDGVLVDQTWEYIGTTCEGDECQDPNFDMLCPDNSGNPPGGSGGGVGEGCCIIDPNAQLTFSSTSISRDYVCGLEGVNPATGNPIKTCTKTWEFHTNTLLWFEWTYISIEKCELEKESGIWKFKTVAHEGIATNGQIPSCISANCSITSTTPSISADKRKARMDLNYTISVDISCLFWSRPKQVSTLGAIEWYAQ